MILFLFTLISLILTTEYSSFHTQYQTSGRSFLQQFITIEGKERYYIVYVPESVREKNEEIPLLVFLHHSVSNSESAQDYYSLNEIAEKHEFIVLYPEGNGNTNNNRSCFWLSCHYIQKMSDQFHNSDWKNPDIIYLEDLITMIVFDPPWSHNVRVNPEKVFLSGHGNGGGMVFAFVQNGTKTFFDKIPIAAIAPIGSAMAVCYYTNCNYPKRVANYNTNTLIAAGLSDVLYKIEGGYSESPIDWGRWDYSVNYSLEYLLKQMGCNGKYIKITEEDLEGKVIWSEVIDISCENQKNKIETLYVDGGFFIYDSWDYWWNQGKEKTNVAVGTNSSTELIWVLMNEMCKKEEDPTENIINCKNESKVPTLDGRCIDRNISNSGVFFIKYDQPNCKNFAFSTWQKFGKCNKLSISENDDSIKSSKWELVENKLVEYSCFDNFCEDCEIRLSFKFNNTKNTSKEKILKEHSSLDQKSECYEVYDVLKYRGNNSDFYSTSFEIYLTGEDDYPPFKYFEKNEEETVEVDNVNLLVFEILSTEKINSLNVDNLEEVCSDYDELKFVRSYDWSTKCIKSLIEDGDNYFSIQCLSDSYIKIRQYDNEESCPYGEDYKKIIAEGSSDCFVDEKGNRFAFSCKNLYMLSVYCGGIISTDENVCSGSGTCISENYCVCEEGFEGDNCEKDLNQIRENIKFWMWMGIGVPFLIVFASLVVVCTIVINYMIWMAEMKRAKKKEKELEEK